MLGTRFARFVTSNSSGSLRCMRNQSFDTWAKFLALKITKTFCQSGFRSEAPTVWRKQSEDQQQARDSSLWSHSNDNGIFISLFMIVMIVGFHRILCAYLCCFCKSNNKMGRCGRWRAIICCLLANKSGARICGNCALITYPTNCITLKAICAVGYLFDVIRTVNKNK